MEKHKRGFTRQPETAPVYDDDIFDIRKRGKKGKEKEEEGKRKSKEKKRKEKGDRDVP